MGSDPDPDSGITIYRLPFFIPNDVVGVIRDPRPYIMADAHTCRVSNFFFLLHSFDCSKVTHLQAFRCRNTATRIGGRPPPVMASARHKCRRFDNPICVSTFAHTFFCAEIATRVLPTSRSIEPPFSLAWLLQPLPSSLANGVLMNPSTAIFACNALIMLFLHCNR